MRVVKSISLIAIGAALAVTQAHAQQSPGFGYRTPPTPPKHGGHGGHHGFVGGIWIVEREVPGVVERVVEVPVAVPVLAAPSPEPREPFVLGKRYASLPGGCMKLIEGQASYYYCGDGEWYRATGKQFLAVRKP